MKKITLLYFIAIATLINSSSKAQQNFTLYNMEVVPQRMYANPAFFPSYSKTNVGLPVISSDYINISNSGFKYSDLIKHRSDDSLYVDYDNMLSKLKDENYLNTSLQVDLLSFGFTIKKNYLSFNMTEKVDLRLRYTKGFMEFLGKGNGGLLGQELNFNLGLDFTHYREYGFGYSRIMNEKLTIGAKLKYLNGMESVQTEKTDISMTTDPNDFSINAKANVLVNTSIDTSLSSVEFNLFNYAFKKKNHGVGVDLGAVYKLNDQFTFSASLIDLGFIKWKEDVINYQSNDPDAQFNFQGLDMEQLIEADPNSDPVTTVTDSISKIFKIDTLHNSYSTRLSTKIYLGANYNFTENVNAGILFYSQFYNKKIHPALSFSFNHQVGRWLNYSLSYSMYNRSYNNIGLGLGLNLGSLQFYVVSDNLLGAIFPQNTKNINIRTGINFTFGREKKDKDKDGIVNKQDKCPDIPGIVEFNGCPDTDKDHVQDSEDLCPTDSGSIVFKGCLDRDNDSIIDILDSCPDIAGILYFNGCPDTDKDSIMDQSDSCPDVAGVPAFNGCPDTDMDGIMDKLDACPAIKGPKSNDGCPISKLNAIDTLGATIKSILMAKDSSFTFDTIPLSDELLRFTLESEDANSIMEIDINVGGKIKKAVKDSSNRFFHFVIAPKITETIIPTAVEEVDVVLEVKEAEILKRAFDNLEFESGKNVIKKESYSSLDELAGLLVKKDKWNLKVSGHTDNQGKASENMKLSEKRAVAIKMYLVSAGITSNRIKVEWFGATKPIADNATSAGRQKNRRVEMKIIE